MRRAKSSLAVGVAVAIAVASAACSPDADGSPTPGARPATAGTLDVPRLDVIDHIEWWNAGLSDEDRDAKYCKMAASPFTFFRGANHLFWRIAPGAAPLATFATAETATWIQADLHPQNFGAFDNDDGEVVYDLNDFDESIVADYQLDLWRMATAMILVADENGNLTLAERDELLGELISSYLAAMSAYAGDDSENQTRFDASTLEDPLREFVEDVAARNDRLEALEDWTIVVDGDRVFDTSLAELEPLSAAEVAAIDAALPAYGATLTGGIDFDPSYFSLKSAARRRFAGIGSLGVPRFYLLIEGSSGDADDDRILDVKEQQAPTALSFDDAARERYEAAFSSHAQRHTIAYKALADDVDDHLGVITLAGRDHSVRERSVFKKSFPTAELAGADYLAVARGWGQILATAHARADDDFDAALIPHSVDVAITAVAGDHGDELTAVIVGLAEQLAAQTRADFVRFVDELAPTTCP